MTKRTPILNRLRLLLAALTMLAFALPALESHACAPEPPSSAVEATVSVSAPADLDDLCPDCGPACSNGCCHAPHFAVMPDLLVEPPSAPTYAAPAAWADASAPPDRRPDGPDRPPRA